MTIGTCYFVNFTKACDYYRDYDVDMTPNELECLVREKLDDGEIYLGKPNIPVGCKLILLDADTRYGIES